MPDASVRLDHANMPARDPEALAGWYAKTFDLQSEGGRVSGPELLIVFVLGEPVKRAPELHLGFRVPSQSALDQWASRFGAQVTPGIEFNAFRVFDPEGNCVELYCKAQA